MLGSALQGPQPLFLLDFVALPLKLVTGPLSTACVELCCVEASDSGVTGSPGQSLAPMGLLSNNANCEQNGLVCHQLVCMHAVLLAICPRLVTVMIPLAEVTDLKTSLVVPSMVGSFPWICKMNCLLTGNLIGSGRCLLMGNLKDPGSSLLIGSGGCPAKLPLSWQVPLKKMSC